MRTLAALMVLSVAVAAQADTITVASFADPSNDSATPLFVYDAGAGTLTGGWSDPGLVLETVSGDFADATFTMDAAPVVAPGTIGAGEILFYDSGDNLLLDITFDSGQMNFIGFGATEFMSLNDVTFSGPILSDPVESESFAFSFANQAPIGSDGSFSATASFTSSALVIPEPATLGLLGLAGFALVRRRR